MRLFSLSIILFLFLGSLSVDCQQVMSNSESRNLLLKMKRQGDDNALKKLFEEGEVRMAELIQAVCDSDRKISINAQAVIQYLADANGLESIEKCRKQSQEFWSPKGIEVFPKVTDESKFLEGSEKGLAQLVARNAYFLDRTRRDLIVVKVVAYNKTKDKALIEVVYNCVPLCGEGWLVSIKNEHGRWRFLSVGMIWQS